MLLKKKEQSDFNNLKEKMHTKTVTQARKEYFSGSWDYTHNFEALKNYRMFSALYIFGTVSVLKADNHE